jgi:hypothetical protein
MNERNLNEGQWEDRKQWSLSIGKRRKSFETDIYIYNIYNIYITHTHTHTYIYIYIERERERERESF